MDLILPRFIYYPIGMQQRQDIATLSHLDLVFNHDVNVRSERHTGAKTNAHASCAFDDTEICPVLMKFV